MTSPVRRTNRTADSLLNTRIGRTITVLAILVVTLMSLGIGLTGWTQLPAEILNFPLSALPGFANGSAAWWTLVLPGGATLLVLQWLAAPATTERLCREEEQQVAQQHGPHVAEDERFGMLACTGVHEARCTLCVERFFRLE